VEQHTAHEALAAHDLELGMSVGVDEEPGLYRIVGVGRDGSLTVFGETERQVRSFLPEWCYPGANVGSGGKRVAGRLPVDRRGLRRRWRAEHGYVDPGEPNGACPDHHRRQADAGLDDDAVDAG
jgi:hypothetical protein